MLYLPFADLYANVYAIVLAGVCIGVIGGFFGISGSFMLTPLLNALGFPMTFAIGTNLTHLFGRSVLTTVKSNAFDHVNWKLGVIIGLTGAGGIQLGKAFMLSLEEKGAAGTVSGALYMILLFGVTAFMLCEHLRSRKSEHTMNVYAGISALSAKVRRINIFPMVYLPNCGGKSISLWFLVLLGMVTGLLSGVMGISGSFIRLPALVFFTGLPILPALCTDILATFISVGFGAAGFAFSGHAEILAAMLLLLGSGIGSHIGHLVTRHVNRVRMKLTLVANVALVFVGVVLKHLGYTTPSAVLMLGSIFVLSLILVVAAVGAAIRKNRSSIGYAVIRNIASNEK